MADSYSSGGGGGNDWEVVLLTASTYAAAPGPVLPLLPLDARKKTEVPPPADSAAIFMSQHFNLPAAEALTTDLNGGRDEDESNPAMVDDDEADDLNIPRPKKDCETEMQGGGPTRSSDSTTLGLDDGDLVADADAESPDGIVTVVDSASLAAHVAGAAPNKGPSSSKIPCEAHAWWNKTFSFLPNNSKESLTFRFLGQRDRLQLRLEFNHDTEKISCAVSEPLGQVKLDMLLGGSPVAQG